jgi:hypothetical protein
VVHLPFPIVARSGSLVIDERVRTAGVLTVGVVGFVAGHRARHRWRPMVGLAVIVALGTAVTLTPLLLARRTNSAFARRMHAVNAAEVMLYGPDEAQWRDPATQPLPTLAGIPGVAGEDRYVGVLAFFPDVPWLTVERVTGQTVGPPFGSGPATIAAVDPTRAATDGRPGSERLHVDRGRAPAPDRPDEILVSPSFARQAGWTIGTQVRAQFIPWTPQLVTAGDAGPETLTTILADTQLTVVGIGSLVDAVRRQDSESIVVGPAFVRARRPAIQYHEHLIHLAPGATAASVIAGAEAAGLGRYTTSYDRPAIAKAYTDSARPHVITLDVFAVIVGLIFLLAIGREIGRDLRRDARATEDLRALGLDTRQVVGIHAIRATAIVAIGVLVGAVVAASGSRRLLSPTVRAIDPVRGVWLEPPILLGGALVIAAGLLAWATPSIVAGARGRRRARQRSSWTADRAARAGAPMAVVEGTRLAFGAPVGDSGISIRSAVGIAALAAAVAVGTSTFSASLDHLITDPRHYGIAWDLGVSANYDVQRDCPAAQNGACDADAILTERARTISSVLTADRDVAGFTPVLTASVPIGDRAVPTFAFGTGAVQPVVLAGALPRSGEVALGPVEVRDRHLKLGDLVPVDGTPMRLVGIVLVTADTDGASGIGRGAVVSLATASQIAPGATNRGFLVRLKDRRSVSVVIDRLRSALAQPAQVFFADRQVEPVTITDYRHIGLTPTVMAIALAGLALVTLGLALTTSVVRHARTLAVMRSLGADRSQIAAIVGAQALIVVAGVIAVAVVAGMLAGRTVWAQLEHRLGTRSGVAWPIAAWAVGTAGLTLVVAALATRSSRKATTAAVHVQLRAE